jgi:acyl-CoA synthetase (AMP-forming)/AMP-acid ligase II
VIVYASIGILLIHQILQATPPTPDGERVDQLLQAGDPAAPCVSFGARHWCYREFDAAVERAAQALRAAGLQPGDRLAVLSTPRPEYLLLWLAASRAGAVYAGLNPRHTADELGAVLRRVQPRLVCSLRGFEGEDLAARLAQAGCAASVLAFDELDELQRALEACAPLPPVPPIAAADDPALARCTAIVFTSGSTGVPKAALLTHQGLLLAARVQHQRLGPPRPRLLSHLPIDHVGCLMNLTLGALVGGGSLVFMERFDAGRTLALLARERITTWLQVPAMFHACVQHPAFDPAALHGLHAICIGGGAASAATLAALRRIGARLFVEYGQTETSSSASYADEGASDEVLAHCVGRFDPRFEFRIADAQGRECGVDEVGEIQGRGPLLFAGYLGDPQATREAFTPDGWLHTGDLASRRADGNVVLRGRLREMIKSGGYNVYPREVEQVLEAHPAVDQVVVLALPDERYGEAVHAVVRWRHGPAARAELDALCRAHLANYKVPKSFRTLEVFPLLPNGKVDRALTRALAPRLAAID